MRRFVRFLRSTILYTLSALFTGGGLVAGVGWIGSGMESGSEDDIAAGIFLGGCLLTVGILIFVMARKVARRGPQPVDLNVVTAVGMAHMMNMSDGDAGFDGGDSGGDFD